MIPLTPTTHDEYLDHLKTQFSRYQDNPEVMRSLFAHRDDLVTLVDLSLDPLRDDLAALYCPTGQGAPKDPCGMLRSLHLMTLEKVASPEHWVKRLTCDPALAILTGFGPGKTPGATTHRDFITRYIDGPYAQRTAQDATLSQTLRGTHERRLQDATKARQAEARREHTTQSDLLCRRLLDQTDTPRDPHALQTRAEHLMTELGLKPSLKAGLLGEARDLTVAGDGTPIASAASADGQKTCTCPPGSHDCDHPRRFTSKTAQWCYHVHRGWVFGDECYTISASCNGHDLPLLTLMGTGNESDFTLSLKALDDLLKLIRDEHLPLNIAIFIGDGHHDALPIYRYLKEQGITAVIPLSEPDPQQPTATHPQFNGYADVSFDLDGTPLCPGNCRMRHHNYQASKDAHFYNCPAMRPNGKHDFVFHPQDCPFAQNCCPDEHKKMGYTLYLPARTNLRYFPAIPRDSKRFKALFKERSGVERSNATDDSYQVDHRCRNAAYALVRLTLVNCAKHAKLRWLELKRRNTEAELFQQAWERILARA